MVEFTDPKGAAPRGALFLPVEGSEPVTMVENRGCHFPVYLEILNPLLSPTATLFCGRQRAIKGDGLGPYCKHHHRIMYKPR